jgi:AcrR family transcriptional regulator
MSPRRRGRPGRGQATVTPDTMLSAALEILGAEGAEALTMRALASRLKINPMTIYHYFDDRDGLIKALSEKVYREVTAPEDGSARHRLEGLLLAYRSQVLRHPGLTLSIFSRPAVFPDQARRITEHIAALLSDLGLAPSRSPLWVNILVDFTHGAALATAMQCQPGNEADPTTSPQDDGYTVTLAELLDSLEGLSDVPGNSRRRALVGQPFPA